MTSGYTGHIAPAEWRWVILVGCVLITLAFIPFLWVVIIGITGTQWRFMGVLHDYQDGAVYLSDILQSLEGQVLTRFLHTPESHRGTFINLLYALLGQIARLVGLSPVIMFHIGRATAALFMYMALYQLAASIWVRLRTRRLFFVLAAVGSGLSWLLIMFRQDASYLDLTLPEAFPFYSTLVNIHYPLATGCLALFAAVIITAFRPGMNAMPTTSNGGGVLFGISIVLSLIYPIAQLLALVGLCVYFALYAYQQRRFSERLLRWLLWFAVPALPLLAYYLAVMVYNPVIRDIFRQENSVDPAAPWIFVLSFGLPLLIALPGLVRGVRRFEPYGDQFMLIWLVSAVLLIYLPTVLQQRFAIGLMIPIAYFATRSVEDVWFNYLQRRWRYRIMVAMIPLIAASHLFVLILPIRLVTAPQARADSGLLLERDYTAAFGWLKDNIASGEVVLAAPNTSLWLPGIINSRVVYGHPTMTVDPALKKRMAVEWFRAPAESPICLGLLNGEDNRMGRFRVRYVMVGPQERRLGGAACVESLDIAVNFGSVAVYSYPLDYSVVP